MLLNGEFHFFLCTKGFELIWIVQSIPNRWKRCLISILVCFSWLYSRIKLIIKNWSERGRFPDRFQDRCWRTYFIIGKSHRNWVQLIRIRWTIRWVGLFTMATERISEGNHRMIVNEWTLLFVVRINSVFCRHNTHLRNSRIVTSQWHMSTKAGEHASNTYIRTHMYVSSTHTHARSCTLQRLAVNHCDTHWVYTKHRWMSETAPSYSGVQNE